MTDLLGAGTSIEGVPGKKTTTFATLTAIVAFGAAAPADAAFPTRVMSAGDSDDKLTDVHIDVGYDFTSQSAQITREWVQDENGNRQAIDVKELDYSNLIQRLVIDLRVGLYKDLELHIQAPIVLSDTSEIGFTEGVEGRSTVFGSGNANDPGFDMGDNYRFPITRVPAERKRAGFGDMRFGLGWSPVNDRKDEAYPTLTLRGDIVAPTGSRRDPSDIEAVTGSGGVGLGQTIFDLSIGVSKRMREKAPYFDPYMLFGAQIPVETAAQKAIGMDAPPSGRFSVGTEVVIHENVDKYERYAVDVSFSLLYTGLGRTYSQLSDYLPNFNQRNVPSDAIDYADYADPSNYANNQADQDCLGVDPNTNAVLLAGVGCGELNRVDEHMRMTGGIAFHIQPSRYFLIRGGFGLGFTTNHLLTAEKVGVDTDPANASDTACPGGCSGRVNASNSNGLDERSQYYDPRYDTPGRRFRAEDIVTLNFFISAIATF